MVNKTLVNLAYFLIFLTLVAGLVFSIEQLPQRSLCLFHNIFDFDCPGCGLTRAFLLIPKWQFGAAIHLNAASLAIYFLFVFMIVGKVKVMLSFKENDWCGWSRFKGAWAGFILVLLTGHWLYKIHIYFSDHPFFEYMTNLIHSPRFWLWMS